MNDQVDYSVSFSGDGRTFAVDAMYHYGGLPGSGHVRIFTLEEASFGILILVTLEDHNKHLRKYSYYLI